MKAIHIRALKCQIHSYEQLIRKIIVLCPTLLIFLQLPFLWVKSFVIHNLYYGIYTPNNSHTEMVPTDFLLWHKSI